MQSNRTTPSRAAGVGTTLSLLLLGILLILAALYFCLSQLRPSIEADLSERVTASLIDAGIDTASISVEGQDITLWGSLPDHATRDRAEKIASEVYGVANVYSQITVKSDLHNKQRLKRLWLRSTNRTLYWTQIPQQTTTPPHPPAAMPLTRTCHHQLLILTWWTALRRYRESYLTRSRLLESTARCRASLVESM